MRYLRTFATVVVAAVLATACGGSDGSSSSTGGDADRTVEVKMVDIAFKPAAITAKKGETIRFVFTNDGKAAHDAFIGDEAAQDGHETEMNGSSDMGDMHEGEQDAITVGPGKHGELTHTFDEQGTVLIGCHQPGHYKAGMKIVVTVS